MKIACGHISICSRTSICITLSRRVSVVRTSNGMEGHNFVLTIIMVVGLELTVSPVFGKEEAPAITIEYTRQQDSDTHRYVKEPPGESDSYVRDGDDYTISINTVSLVVVCRATYPVYWQMNSVLRDKEAIDDLTSYSSAYIFMERKVGDFHQESTYQYSTTLVFYDVFKALTGNYSCHSATENRLQKSIYIYIQDVAPPFLMHAEKTMEVEVDGDSVLLPCNSYSPDVLVYLLKKYKKVNKTEEWNNIPLNESVTYDPKVGFILKISDLPNIFGEYKCTTNETEDFVHVNILQNKNNVERHVEVRHLEGTASVEWDKSTSQFSCCSNSDKAPQLRISYCENYVLCQHTKEILMAVISHNLTTFLQHNYWQGDRPNGSCAKNQLWEDTSYVFYCAGDGISFFSELYPSPNRTENPPKGGNNLTIQNLRYHQKPFDIHNEWDHIRLEDQILVELNPYYNVEYQPIADTNASHEGSAGFLRRNKEIFTGTYIYVDCTASEYFFARGVIWSIQTKDGQTEVIYNVSDPHGVYTHYGPDEQEDYYPQRYDNHRTTKVVATNVMESISCHAPVWNSTKWVSSSLKLNITESILPKIEGNELETVYWTLNDTDMVLKCKIIQGIPLPLFEWTKEGSTIQNEIGKYFEIETRNASTYLKVKLVSHDIHGQFACRANNVAGNSTKTFNVFVEEHHSFMLIIGGVSVIVIFLVALVGYLMWRMKKQHAVLTSLRNHTYSTG